MEIFNKLKEMRGEKKLTVGVTVCGISGLLLIITSSLVPEKKPLKSADKIKTAVMSEAEDYCSETEKRLESFLGKIDGAGEVKVYLTVVSNERYVYAAEGRRSKAENRLEEEEKYVMTGNGSEKKPLIETVKAPEISGAVIACSGCESPQVQERVYKAVSAALNIPTTRIYVTKLS